MNRKKIIMIIILLIILASIPMLFIYINSNKTIPENNNEISEQNNDKIEEETLVLKDKYFITQLNDIYYNIDEYKGKKIEIEGFPMTNEKSTFVGRYGPGCCSIDGYAYIEYKFSEKLELVDEKDWIKVTGTIQKRYEGNIIYVYIDATSVEKLDTRGTDRVIN